MVVFSGSRCLGGGSVIHSGWLPAHLELSCTSSPPPARGGAPVYVGVPWNSVPCRAAVPLLQSKSTNYVNKKDTQQLTESCNFPEKKKNLLQFVSVSCTDWCVSLFRRSTNCIFRPDRMQRCGLLTASVCLSQCLLDRTASPANTAEPIEVPLACGLEWAQGTVSLLLCMYII